METRWRITLFGGLRAEYLVSGSPAHIVEHFPRRTTAALLAYLAYQRRSPQPRETLLELFWPKEDGAAARRCLNTALWELRSLLELPADPQGAHSAPIVSDGNYAVGLNWEFFTTDVQEFEAALRAAGRAEGAAARIPLLTAAVELYDGELLLGFYDEWVQQAQPFWRERWMVALHQLIEDCHEVGDDRAALEWALRIVGAHPFDERAHRAVMRLHAALGQGAAALEHYRELKRWLGKEDLPLGSRLYKVGPADEEFSGAGTGDLPTTPRGQFEEPAAPGRDPVDCTVFAPGSVRRGAAFLVQVTLHRPEQARQAQRSAREADPDTHRRGAVSLATELARGSVVTCQVRLPGLEGDGLQRDTTWRGRVVSVQFELRVPHEIQDDAVIGTVLVLQGSIPIGEIRFRLAILDATAQADSRLQPAGEARRYQHAFISYASKDRKKVLPRVQMLPAAGIRFFMDVRDLCPGEPWEEVLYRYIEASDVLFLFWSTAAKRSRWVKREWRFGLSRKGDRFIQPVMIEGPPPAPPPSELKHLHFDDPLLYLICAHEISAQRFDNHTS